MNRSIVVLTLVALTLVALTMACSPRSASTSSTGTKTSPEAAPQLKALADDYFKAFVESFPIGATFAGVPEAPADRLGDNSLAFVRSWEQREDAWLKQLQPIDASALAGGDVATYGVLKETLEASIAGRVCKPELWPLNQQSGLQTTLPFLAQLQPLGAPDDEAKRAKALARWRAMPKYIDNEIETLREGVRQGYTQPKPNVEAVIAQLDDIAKLPPAKSPFAALGGRDNAPGFRDAVVSIVADGINPALGRYRAFLKNEYLPQARQSTAIRDLPNGEACYRTRVRQYATVDMDARAVHQLGLDQMAELERQMAPLAQEAFGSPDVAAAVAHLRDDRALKFKTREEIIKVAQDAATRAKAAMPKFLTRFPKADFIVDPCQPFEEKSGCPGSYVPGTPDGSRPGRFRINAGDPTEQPRATAEGTAFHEGIPGHHLQISLAQERTDAHPLTRYFFFSGFSEGWALYSERVADETGLYSSAVDRLGDLGEQALRAARLVVDPGLHVLGWSRQQAIDYMAKHLVYPRSYIESEVDRYIADPGQATAYMIGRLEIERLRAEAMHKLGSRFDVRRFHDHVLENGSVPLTLLRADIERWIASPNPP
jgi:uncharacterized protein (DUF885 family)